MLEAIFGTRARVCIIEELAKGDLPLTRNQLVLLTAAGRRSVYEQIKELVVLGVVEQVARGGFRLVPDHPLTESLRSLVLLSTAYRQEMVSQLPSAIHKHLHPEYYVGGYLAATRRVTPIDIALPLLEIYVTHEFWDRAVLLQRAWGHLREISLSRDPRAAVWLEVQECTHIPEDVKEESMPSGPVVFASVEHGLVDCFIEGRVDDYVSVLLLLQNREADVIDTRNLVSQARSHEGGERVLAAAAALNRLAENDRLFDLSPLDTPDFVPQPILKASRNAWNTIKGG